MKLPQHPASLKTDDAGVTVPTVHGFGSDRAEELAAKEIQRLWVRSTAILSRQDVLADPQECWLCG